LRQGGFDVVAAYEAGKANLGTPDEEQLEFAPERGMAILTHNVADF
jgi:hypothetical protein